MKLPTSINRIAFSRQFDREYAAQRMRKHFVATVVEVALIGSLMICQPVCAVGTIGQQTNQQTVRPEHAPIQSATTQFLILKTGSVYSGQLEFGGGKYVIRRRNGSSVRFQQGEVDFVTHSLNDAYNRLFARVQTGDVIGHQRLATWCLKHRLVDPARQQVAVLKNLANSSGNQSRMTRLLERQVEDLANPRTESSATEQSTKTPVQVASHESVKEREVRRLPNTGTQMASRAELKATVDSFKLDTIRDFNRTVHLRIVNGCAAARCHGDPENPMRIWKVDNRGGINSTGVQRNLHSLTKYLNRSNPIDSDLLKYISQPHGDMDEPAYEETSHHFQAIKAWVLSAGLATNGTLTDQDDAVSQTSFQTEPSAPSMPNEIGLAANATSLSPDELAMNNSNSIPAPIDLSKTEPRFVPKDEFDPEIFNRRFLKQVSVAANSASDKEAPLQSTANETLKQWLNETHSETHSETPSEMPSEPKNSTERIKSLPPIDDQ